MKEQRAKAGGEGEGWRGRLSAAVVKDVLTSLGLPGFWRKVFCHSQANRIPGHGIPGFLFLCFECRVAGVGCLNQAGWVLLLSLW